MYLEKKILSLVCVAAMASGLAACSSDSSSESSPDNDSKPAASELSLTPENFAENLGAGWNLGNTLEAVSGGEVSETAWGNPKASQEMIDAVADAGFKTIRVPVSYIGKINDENNYMVEPEWLDRVKEVVDYCYTRDLFVIINVHGDGYNSIPGGWLLINGDDQDTIKERYKHLWDQIAEQFKDYDEHLIFESMNEVFDGTYGDPNREYYGNLNAYNQIFVDTVRASGSENTHRWLMVPGWNTDINYTVGDYGFQMPTDSNNSSDTGRLVLSVHCYDPWDYCGTENNKTFLWGERGQEIVEINGASPKNTASWGKEDHIDAQMEKLKTGYVDKGIPVIIGEYGCIDKTGANAGIPNQIAENRVYYNGYLAGAAALRKITPVYWDNGYNGKYGFGLFNRTTCEQTQPEIIQSIITAVKDKNPDAGHKITVDRYTSASSGKTEKTGIHAYIGIQTEVYTFRNGWSDGTYGAESEWFNTLIKWEDTDGDGKDDIVDTGAAFTDAEITGDGDYSVKVSGYDFSADSNALNMLFISTDTKFSSKIKVTNVTLLCDDQEIAIKNPIVSEDNTGNLYIELVNKYNDAAPKVDYVMPKNSFEIRFTISGT